jgi:hypothetical protein
MVGRVFAAAAAVLIVACSPALFDPITIDFSWQGAKGCITLFLNPEIRMRNVPPGAKLLLLTLAQGTREMGGQEIPLPENGILPPGAIGLCSLSSRAFTRPMSPRRKSPDRSGSIASAMPASSADLFRQERTGASGGA